MKEPNRNRRRDRLSPATVLAGLALFVSLGGTSIAASGLINGNKIKPGTVTGKQIKNKTISAAKLDAKTVASLRGKAGPKGEPGAKGEPGPASLPAAYEDESDVLTFPANAGAITVAELELPAGRYMVTAKAVLRPQASADTSCWVAVDYGDYLDHSQWSSTGSYDTGTLSLTGITPAGAQILSLNCYLEDVAGTTGRNKLVAIPVAG